MCRGISDYKKGYQPRTDIVKDEKCDLVADCHSILAVGCAWGLSSGVTSVKVMVASARSVSRGSMKQ